MPKRFRPQPRDSGGCFSGLARYAGKVKTSGYKVVVGAAGAIILGVLLCALIFRGKLSDDVPPDMAVREYHRMAQNLGKESAQALKDTMAKAYSGDLQAQKDLCT